MNTNFFIKTILSLHGIIMFLILIFGIYIILGLLFLITKSTWFLVFGGIFLLMDLFKHHWMKNNGFKLGKGLTYEKE